MFESRYVRFDRLRKSLLSIFRVSFLKFVSAQNRRLAFENYNPNYNRGPIRQSLIIDNFDILFRCS